MHGSEDEDEPQKHKSQTKSKGKTSQKAPSKFDQEFDAKSNFSKEEKQSRDRTSKDAKSMASSKGLN
jgi:hypothetical protein